jgi:hypothetical protein
LHRSNPNDVARVEHLTFICTPTQGGGWPDEQLDGARRRLREAARLFDGSMKGRTMYVVPYVMGPAGSPMAKIGIELTDSIYVALNMRIMTRMGQVALDMLGGGDDFNRGLHSTLDVNPERRFICHFPQDNTIWSSARLRRQRAARQEVPRAAHRQRTSGEDRGLARGAHADPRRRVAPRGDDLRRGGVPERVRQDQLRDDDPAGALQRLEASGPSATTSRGCASAPDGRLWAINPEPATSASRRAPACALQPERDRDCPRTRSSPTWR